MSTKVYIMRGPSGSGKSTYVKRHFPNAIVISADAFWGPEYKFDIKRLGEAHSWALRNFVNEITKAYVGDSNSRDGGYEQKVIVVDNTNTTTNEIAPYYAVAEAYGCKPEIISLNTVTPEMSFQRNVHRVPMEAVKRQHDNFIRAGKAIPKNWRHKIINSDEESKAGIHD